MAIYLLRIPPYEVIRVVRAETEAESGQPQLYEDAWQDYVIEENYDRRARGLGDGEEYDLVSIDAVLKVEPRLEQNYWVLSVVAHKEVGPRVIEDESGLIGAELSLDEFEANFLGKNDVEVSVRLEAQSPEAKKHFDRWWADLCQRHVRKPEPADQDRA
jgi:hypothetical protein